MIPMSAKEAQKMRRQLLDRVPLKNHSSSAKKIW